MRKTTKSPLSDEDLARLSAELDVALGPDFGKTGPLDEMVAIATAAANRLVQGAVQSKVIARAEVDAGPAPICPNPDCDRGKKGAARVSSRSARRRS